MIEQELLFLGLLKEGPKHGYEIKKKIQEIISLFAGLEIKSVYYPLRILEKKGLIVKEVVKQPKRPTRFSYSLSNKGEDRFNLSGVNSTLLAEVPLKEFGLDTSQLAARLFN